MPLVSVEQTTEDLADHLNALRSLINGAWAKYHEQLLAEAQVAATRRSRASLVHDLMIAGAKHYALSNPDVRVFERLGMKGLVFKGRYAVRFKKLDEDARSKNQRTRQVEAFRAQQELEGIDAIHHLEVGYILNREETKIAEIMLVCPAGKSNHWTALLEGAEARSQQVIELPRQETMLDEEGAVIAPKPGALKKRTRRPSNG